MLYVKRFDVDPTQSNQFNKLHIEYNSQWGQANLLVSKYQITLLIDIFWQESTNTNTIMNKDLVYKSSG